MFQFEQELISKGIRYVAAIDEVGRGCLAGPMAVGCVVYDLHEVGKWLEQNIADEQNSETLWINDVKDSKKLSAKKREKLAELILHNTVTSKVFLIENSQIDENGISWAEKFGFSQALKLCEVEVDFVLTDAFPVLTVHKALQKNIIGGDAVSFSIASASIFAKVTRDKLMVENHEAWPVYGFDKHKGYGTAFHLQMIKENGICNIHRKSFEPIKSMHKISANK
jgi:ribonuclease HII